MVECNKMGYNIHNISYKNERSHCMKERISIVMATYQGVNYIKEQLDSIFHQTLPPDEIIIYDDASTDQTLTIAKQYQFQDDVKVHIFKQDHRVGYIKNFAKALKMSNGDIIFLCDQDDLWEPNKIEQMVSIFHTHPEITCINTSFTYINETGKPIVKDHGGNNFGMCFQTVKKDGIIQIPTEDILNRNLSMGCTMAFRKEVKDVYLNNTNFSAPHDWELNFCSALSNGLYFYNTALIKYRIHTHNTTGNDKVNGKNHIYASEREKNAQTILTFLSACEKYRSQMDKGKQSFLDRLIIFHEKRVDLLKTGKKLNWLYLIAHSSIYKKIVSKKGILTDLIYAIHK